MRVNGSVTDRDIPVSGDANILSTTDPKGWITHINEEFVSISGFSREELIGQPHNLVRHPDMPRLAFDQMWGNLRQGRSWMGLVKNRCKNGDHYWVHAYATPITDASGRVLEYQSIRTGPTSTAAVARAERLYARLRAAEPDKGPLPPVKTRRGPALRLTLGAMLLGVGLLQAGLLLALQDPAAAALALAPVPLGLAGCHALLRPLGRLSARARRIIDDPLMQRVLVGRRDELGQIEMALLSLETELGAVTKRLSDTVGDLGGSAASTAASVSEARDQVAQQSGQTEQVAAAVHEMSQTVQEIARGAADAADAAVRARGESDRGSEVVGRSRAAVDDLVSQVEHSAGVIQRLSEETANITQVLDVIRQVTEQTNLLALNAAIEAARAGDSGRGFAVVADEVRVLASRTHDSTHEISAIIDTLRSVAEEAVETMGASQARAAETREHAVESESVLQRIAEAVDSIRDLNAGIASATEQQSATAEEINRSITAIKDLCRDVNEHIGSAAERTAGVAAEVERTRGLVDRFRRSRRA